MVREPLNKFPFLRFSEKRERNLIVLPLVRRPSDIGYGGYRRAGLARPPGWAGEVDVEMKLTRAVPAPICIEQGNGICA